MKKVLTTALAAFTMVLRCPFLMTDEHSLDVTLGKTGNSSVAYRGAQASPPLMNLSMKIPAAQSTVSSGVRGDQFTADALSCDKYPGNDAAARIAACIGALPSGGGVADARKITGPQTWSSNPFPEVMGPVTVLLGEATFTFSVTPLVPANVQIIGQGIGKTILQEASNANLKPDAVATVSHATNIVIRDLTIDLNAANNTGPEQAHGLDINAAFDSQIQNVEVRNFYGHEGGTGIAFVLTSTTDVTVSGCYVHDVGLVRSSHLSDGIYTSGVRNQMMSNVVEAWTDTGLVVENSADGFVAGNVLYGKDVGLNGIGVSAFIQRATIVGNEISGTELNGIGVLRIDTQPATVTTKTITIAGNTIHDTLLGKGIHTYQADDVTISGNILTNISTAYQDTGIYVEDGHGVAVVGNTISGSGGYGIVATGTTNLSLLGNTVTNNSQRGGSNGIHLGISNTHFTVAEAPAGASRTNNIVTIKLSGSNPLMYQPGDLVRIQDVASQSFNGTFQVLSEPAPSPSTLSYLQSGADATSGNGTARRLQLNSHITGNTSSGDLQRCAFFTDGTTQETFLLGNDLQFNRFDPAACMNMNGAEGN